MTSSWAQKWSRGPHPDVEASVHSAGSLSRALSAAIESHERLLSSSHASSDELMRATLERRDAMSSVRDSLNEMPPDAVLDEPMIRQHNPLVPTWLPELMQRALGNEVSSLGAGIAEHAAAASLPVMLESTDSHALTAAMNIFGEQVDAANRRARSEGGARSIVSGVASAVGSALGLRSRSPPPGHAAAHEHSNANVTNVRVRVEPPRSEHAASDIHDANNHRSVTEVGANGPVPVGAHAPENYTIHTPPTPPTTLP